MKLNKILFAAAITAAAMFAASCNIVPEPEPGPGPGQDTIPGQDTTVVGDVLTVAQAIAAQDASVKYVQGYVVGWYSNHTNDRCVVFSAAATADTTVLKTNIVLADAATETDATKVVCVQLPVGPLRDALNLNANPSVLGATVKVHGSLTAYNSLPGVKEIDEAWLNGTKIKTTVDADDLVGDGSRTNPYTYADVVKVGSVGTAVTAWVKATIVGQVTAGANSLSASTFETSNFTGNDGGQNTNVLLAAVAGETDFNNVIGLQLPSGAIRNGLNLVQNPTLMGQEILVYGSIEKYFGKAGIKSPTYVEFGTTKLGSDPDVVLSGILAETLLTQASFDKFTAISVTGAEVWTFDSKYGAKMSGYVNGATLANEDWFISPAMDLTGKTGVKLTFEHAFGPSIPADLTNYTVLVSNDFNGTDVATATWTPLTIAKPTTKWTYISSGDIDIPAANLAANCRIAWKYVCDNNTSATWEIKNVVVQ